MKIFVLTLSLFFCGSAIGASNYYEGTDVISPTPSALSVGGSYTETTTGSTITRLTDHADLTPDSPDGSLVVCSRYTQVNSNGTYALVHGTDSSSSWILRLSDNTIIHKINPGNNVGASNDEIGENNEIRWDYTGSYPNRIYFVYLTKFYQMDVIDDNDTSTELYDITSDYPTAAKILNDVEGDSSANSRYWAWQVLDPYDGSKYPRIAYVVYDKTTDALIGTLDPGDVTPAQNASAWVDSFPPVNMIEISPNGDKVMLNSGRCYTGGTFEDFCGTALDGPHVWNLDFTSPIKVAFTETHAGWAFKGGKQMFISQVNNILTGFTESIQACYADGTGGTYPDNCIRIMDFDSFNSTGIHWARMVSTHPGWIFGSTYQLRRDTTLRNTSYSYGDYTSPDGIIQYRCTSAGTTGATDPTWDDGFVTSHKIIDGTVEWQNRGLMYLDNQSFMLELVDMNDGETPRIWRITPTYNNYSGNYRDEVPAALSMDMKTILVTSNWNTESPAAYPGWSGGEVYKVELPTDWLDVLNGVTTEGGFEIIQGTGSKIIPGTGCTFQ